jgi:hypothetical protein
VRLLERLGDLEQLAARLRCAPVHRSADAGRAHLEGGFDAAVHGLVVEIGVRQELVVVQLADERDAMSPAPRAHRQHAERRGHPVAAPLEAELDDVLRIEHGRVGRERGRGGVLDPLIDRQDRDVAGAGQAAVRQEALEVDEDAGRAVAVHEHAIHEVGTGQVDGRGRDGRRAMLEQARRIAAQGALNVAELHGHGRILED